MGDLPPHRVWTNLCCPLKSWFENLKTVWVETVGLCNMSSLGWFTEIWGWRRRQRSPVCHQCLSISRWCTETWLATCMLTWVWLGWSLTARNAALKQSVCVQLWVLRRNSLSCCLLTFLQQGSDSWFVRHHQQVAHIGLFSLIVSAWCRFVETGQHWRKGFPKRCSMVGFSSRSKSRQLPFALCLDEIASDDSFYKVLLSVFSWGGGSFYVLSFNVVWMHLEVLACDGLRLFYFSLWSLVVIFLFCCICLSTDWGSFNPHNASKYMFAS